MKKTVFALIALIFLCSSFSMPYASASDAPLEAEKTAAGASDAVSESAAETAPDQMELLSDWETNGYPGGIGGVYYDEATGKLTVMLVNGSEMRRQELLSMAQDAPISFGVSRYSYNELLAVQKQITEEMSSSRKVYSVGIGWTVIDGEVTGFGESGKEFRVVVRVDESVLDEYVNTYESLYGDMVHVEAGDRLYTSSRDISLISNSVPTQPLPIALTAGLLAAFMVLFLGRHRLAYAAQTTAGTSTPIQRCLSGQEVVRAVKEASVSPPDSVREALMKKLIK